MILVNNPGSWGVEYQYAPLRHADWHGCTFTDLVFPTFLFCAGVAIVPALSRKLAAGVPRGRLAASIGKRVLWLVLLGMFLSAFPLLSFAGEWTWQDLFAPLLRMRFPGVLQRIGLCYGIAGLLFVFGSVALQRAVLVVALAAYWPLITLVPIPGVGAPDLDVPSLTLPGYVDRALFGDHIWVKGEYDPEGLLSTLPAVATCLIGVEAGRVLQRLGPLSDKIATLLRHGVLWMLVGTVAGWFLPINKALWTSSYATWTAGIAMAGLGLCVWLFEQLNWQRLAHPLRVYGTNALLVFVGSGIVGRVLGQLLTVTAGDQRISVKAWRLTTCCCPLRPPKSHRCCLR